MLQEAQLLQTEHATSPTNHMFPKTRLLGLHFCRWLYESTFSEFDAVGSEAAVLCEITRTDSHQAIQSHQFWYWSKARMQLPINE